MNQPTREQAEQGALDFFAQMTEDYANSLPKLAAQCVRMVAGQQGQILAESTQRDAKPAAPQKRESALAQPSGGTADVTAT